MNATALLGRLELRAVGIGLGIFLLLTTIAPFLATLVASLGPRDWIAAYLVPARVYEPALYVAAGALAAFVIPRAPVLNSLLGALLGALTSLTLAVWLGASPHLDVTGFAVEYLVVPLGWFSAGAGFVVLSRRIRHAL